MTKTNYEQKKRECWEEFRKEHPEISCKSLLRNFVDFIFDRAYSLGKQEKDADSTIQGLDIELQCNDRILGNLADSFRKFKEEKQNDNRTSK